MHPMFPLVYIYTPLHISFNNVKAKNYDINCLDITGPLAVGKAINRFFGKDETSPFSVVKYSDKIKVLYLGSNDLSDLKIVDEMDTELVRIKFKGYYTLMYSDMSTYGNIWDNRLVYITPLEI